MANATPYGYRVRPMANATPYGYRGEPPVPLRRAQSPRSGEPSFALSHQMPLSGNPHQARLLTVHC
ncbi:MAG: hypothetical protein KME46_02700 [Brasilonema angustatum HA4187-MV1]|jgi:hypothetical protein|nr:hypothetical protein [Brasilonema angustatum HA4187-MV1]